MMLLGLNCSNKKQIESVGTPSQALETFIKGMMTDDSDAILSVTGDSRGNKLDDVTLAMLKQQMDSLPAQNPDSLSIERFQVVEEKIDGRVALCILSVTLTDGSEATQEGTLILGEDGHWRLPVFE